MHIRLTYFDFPFWRAEASRIALYLAGVPFEDARPSGEEFRRMKAAGELPYGQLPVLDVDGVRIGQSVAIARFCGRLAGLYPMDDPVAAAQVDELMDTANQITETISPSVRTQDPEKKAALRAELGKSILPHWLDKLERRLSQNSPAPVFVGTGMTMADLIIWRLVAWLGGGILDGIPADIIDPFPGLKGHQAHMNQLPEIRSWMDSRHSPPK